ncbi:hypothetical protein G9A89_017052 [Geosiphon pyriformis]|nr:hypothetical protein G9A89_017052 [Geosiphon pyriformis]
MDLEAVFSNSMSSKKALKSVFHSPAGGFFLQRKKTSLGNVKHSGDEKNISLKFGFNASVYFDVKSLSGNDDNVSMSGGFNVNTGANFGSPISSSDFEMDEEMKPLLSPLRKKIIKTPVEVLVKKSFAFNINLLAVEGKLAMQKTQFVKKIFSKINGFREATASSKFEEIIKSTFTSEKSMKKAVLLAGKNGISVNNNLRKQGFRSDWVVVIKKIPMDTSRNMIIAAVSKFGQIKSIKIQLIGMWQKAVIEFAELTSRDQFRTLLFTLPVEITAHNLGTLLEKAGRKTCIINCSLETGNRFRCAVVGFESNEELESAFLIEPIFERNWENNLRIQPLSTLLNLYNNTFRTLSTELTLSTKLWRTSTNNTKPKVAESETIRANHLGFAKVLFQHYCQHLGLNHNHISAESAFNFYVNKKIFFLLGTPVNTKSARETFYRKLIQNTNLPTNYNFASIITEINKEIEHHTQQRYPITYTSKGKGKLQTPVVTPKRIQPLTWKKTRIESPTDPSYYYTH